MHDEIVKADITPEKIVKSFQNIAKIMELEDKPAMTFVLEYKGDVFSASLDMHVIRIDSKEIDDSVWEQIRQSNITSETLLTIIKKLENFLNENGQASYKVPIPIGLKPIKSGYTFSLDLRVYPTEEE